MPYISERGRQFLQETGDYPTSPGELNYLITKLVDFYLSKEVNYTSINEVIGVLECAKLELYRRIAAPYEDKKLAQNGDVYTVGKE